MWTGEKDRQTYAQNISFPSHLLPGTAYVLTVLIDHMGQDEEAPGTDASNFRGESFPTRYLATGTLQQI